MQDVFFLCCFGTVFAQWELFGQNNGPKMGVKRDKHSEAFVPNGSSSFSIMCLPASSIKAVYESCARYHADAGRVKSVYLMHIGPSISSGCLETMPRYLFVSKLGG